MLIIGVLRPCSIQTEGVVGVVTLDLCIWLPDRVVVGVLWPGLPSREILVPVLLGQQMLLVVFCGLLAPNSWGVLASTARAEYTLLLVCHLKIQISNNF